MAVPGALFRAGKKVFTRGAKAAVALSPAGGVLEAGKAIFSRDGGGLVSALAGGRGGGGGRKGSVRFVSVGKRGVVGLSRGGQVYRTVRTGSTAHIGKNLPTHRQLTRLRRNLKRHVHDAVTVLSMAAPGRLSHGRGRRGGFVPRRRSKSRRRR